MIFFGCTMIFFLRCTMIFFLQVHHDGDGHTDHQHMNHGAFQHSSLRSILLLIALSFHSVFEVGRRFFPKNLLIMSDFEGACNRSADGQQGDAGDIHGSDDAQGRDGLQPWS